MRELKAINIVSSEQKLPSCVSLLAQEGFLFFQPATIVPRDRIQTEYEVKSYVSNLV